MNNIDSSSKAYLFGLIVAEGSEKIKIESKNRKFLKTISKELLNFLPIKIESKKSKIEITFKSSSFQDKICDFSLKNLDSKFVDDFVRGFFDKTGKIKSTKTTLYSKNKKLIEEIYLHYGIPAKLKIDKLRYEDSIMIDFLSQIYDKNLLYKSKNYCKYVKICTLKSKNLKFEFTKLNSEAVAPFKARASDSGFDLTLLKRIKKIGEVEMYSTGIAIKPSYGYYFDLVPRSSIIKSGYILANSIGIIDRTYRGEILIPLIKIDKNQPDLTLPARIVQLIPREITHFRFEEKRVLDSTHRDAQGFGSSGI